MTKKTIDGIPDDDKCPYSDPFVIGHCTDQDRIFYNPVEAEFDIWDWMLKSYCNQSPFKAVEIGSRSVCNKSALKSHMEKHHPFATYIGVDIHPGDGVDLVCDVHELSKSVAKASADLVYSSAVFEHLAMPWIAAEEIATVLKPGGLLVIHTHFSFSEHETPWHFFQFNNKGLEVLFNRQLGFEVISSGKALPMIGRFAIDCPPSHAGKPIGQLYCSSWIVARRTDIHSVQHSETSAFSWRGALPSVIGDTAYPPHTGLSSLAS